FGSDARDGYRGRGQSSPDQGRRDHDPRKDPTPVEGHLENRFGWLLRGELRKQLTSPWVPKLLAMGRSSGVSARSAVPIRTLRSRSSMGTVRSCRTERRRILYTRRHVI